MLRNGLQYSLCNQFGSYLARLSPRLNVTVINGLETGGISR